LQLADVAPRGAVGHAHPRDGAAQRALGVDEPQELRASAAELRAALEHDPDLRLRLHARRGPPDGARECTGRIRDGGHRELDVGADASMLCRALTEVRSRSGSAMTRSTSRASAAVTPAPSATRIG